MVNKLDESMDYSLVEFGDGCNSCCFDEEKACSSVIDDLILLGKHDCRNNFDACYIATPKRKSSMQNKLDESMDYSLSHSGRGCEACCFDFKKNCGDVIKRMVALTGQNCCDVNGGHYIATPKRKSSMQNKLDESMDYSYSESGCDSGCDSCCFDFTKYCGDVVKHMVTLVDRNCFDSKNGHYIATPKSDTSSVADRQSCSEGVVTQSQILGYSLGKEVEMFNESAKWFEKPVFEYSAVPEFKGDSTPEHSVSDVKFNFYKDMLSELIKLNRVFDVHECLDEIDTAWNHITSLN